MDHDSNQLKLGRLRQRIPNVHYDATIDGVAVKKELPFVVGILGAFCGPTPNSCPLLRDRTFIAIDRDNFNSVMSSLEVSLHLTLPDRINSDNPTLTVRLIFGSIHDFEPVSIIAQVEPLQRLLEIRNRLAECLVQCHNAVSQTTFDIPALPDSCRDFVEELEADFPVSRADGSEILVRSIAVADMWITSQLSEILHHPDFQQLEGSWRGLRYLVFNTESGSSLKLKVLPVTKNELRQDINDADDFDMSVLFRKLDVHSSSTKENDPFGLLIGDFEFGNSPEDNKLLHEISSVCAAILCPMVSSISADFLGLQQWSDLAKAMDIQKVFESLKDVTWQIFRDSEDSRFVALTLPRVLARLPYLHRNGPAGTFADNESLNEFIAENHLASPHDCCWMNAAYALAATVTRVFEEARWGTAHPGATNGGVVENIPACQMVNANDEATSIRSTEVNLAGRRELELSNLGLIPLCYCQQLDRYRFYSMQTCHRPKRYLEPDASANAELAAKLPCVMTTSRFAHFLQCIVRDTTRRFMYRDEIEDRLNHWITRYVAPISEEEKLKSRYPLAEAQIRLQHIPGRPGHYRAIALLRPNLPNGELTTPVKISIDLPLGRVVQDG